MLSSVWIQRMRNRKKWLE